MKSKILFLFFILNITALFGVDYKITYNANPGGNPGLLNTLNDDITSGWTAVSSGNETTNGLTAELPLPFPFYIGNTVSNGIKVSRNGLVYFKNEANVIGSQLGTDNLSMPVPMEGSNPIGIFIAAFWDQFTTTNNLGAQSRIYVKTFGTSPNRQYWIKWHNYKLNSAYACYWACVLEETTNKIYIVDYNYDNINGQLLSTTVGLQHVWRSFQHSGSPNITMTKGGTTNVSDNKYYTFTPYVPKSNEISLIQDTCGPSVLKLAYYDVSTDYVDYYWQGQNAYGTSFANKALNGGQYYTYGAGSYYLRAYDFQLKKWADTSAFVEDVYYNEIPDAPDLSVSTNLCGDKTLTLESSPPNDGGVFWQNSETEKKEAILDNAENYNKIANISGGYYLRAFNYGYDNDMGIFNCWSPATTVNVVVNQPPSKPSTPNITSSDTCGSKTISQVPPPNDVMFFWQTISSGTSQENSALNKSADTTGNYYSRALSTAGCWSANSSVIYVTILPQPDKPSGVISNNDCGAKTIALNAPPTNITNYWQTETSGTSVANSSLTLNATNSASYYSRARHVSGCWSPATEFQLAVYNYPSTPSAPTLSANECGDKIITRPNPSSQNDIYYWQNDSLGTSTASSTKNYTLTKSGKIYLRALTENSGCWSLASVASTAEVKNPYDNEQICIITADPKTGNNLIAWKKTNGVNTQSFKIYKQGDVANVFESMGQLTFADTSVFEDVNTSKLHAEIYKITTVDSCNQELSIAKAKSHKTIFLQFNGNTKGTNLIWFNYEIDNVPYVFDSYVLYRSTDSSKLAPFATIAGNLNQFTDTSDIAKSKQVFYRIGGVISTACDPLSYNKASGGPFSQSISNLEDNRLKGISIREIKGNDRIKIYPNPIKNTIHLSSDINIKKVEIYAVSGVLLMTKENLNTTEISLNAPDYKGFVVIKVYAANNQMYYSSNIIE